MGEIHAMGQIKCLGESPVAGTVNNQDFITYRLIHHGIGTAGAYHPRTDHSHFTRFPFHSIQPPMWMNILLNIVI
ncbi:hypothetical protein D1872_322370 [compost metagenome]